MSLIIHCLLGLAFEAIIYVLRSLGICFEFINVNDIDYGSIITGDQTTKKPHKINATLLAVNISEQLGIGSVNRYWFDNFLQIM